MKGQVYGQTVDRKKVVIIGALYAASAAITLFGLAFSAYSAANHMAFKVLQAEVPGVVFGAIVVFLGIRYFLSVMRLKREVYKPDSRFSWSNFKRK